MNVFEFNTYDLTDFDKNFYKPFRYEIPKDGLMSIEDFVVFCKNVAVLLSFSEETFNNGIRDYIEGIDGYDTRETFIDEAVDNLGVETIDKVIKEVENKKKFPSTKIKPCLCGQDGCFCTEDECDCKDDEYSNPSM
jgi:hypothetical protein